MKLKRYFRLTGFLLGICLVSAAGALADTIKDGTIFYSAGHYLADQPIRTGFDPFGYNYQAHLFSGSYFNAYAGGAGFPPYEGDDDAYLADNPGAAAHWAWPWRGVDLSMKWNDAWISNQDFDGDHFLDRHPGYPGYTDSGAWMTNHMSSSYEVEVNGKIKEAHWTYFTKIVTPSSYATVLDGVFYNEEGVEIGPVIWGAFATVQDVENDPFAGIHGKQYGSPAGPGFGQYGPGHH
jgi:hypothetical protein